MSTPGPWRILTDGTIWSDVPGKFGLRPNGDAVAKVATRRTATGEYFDRSDAELIAAAPELRAMVERLKSDLVVCATSLFAARGGNDRAEDLPSIVAANALLERTKP